MQGAWIVNFKQMKIYTSYKSSSDTYMVIYSFLRRFMSPKRSQKFPVRTHKIGTFSLNLDNDEKF